MVVNAGALTPKERFLKVLAHGAVDRLPLVIRDVHLPGPPADEQLLEHGVCVIVKSTIWRVSYSDRVEVRERLRVDTHGRWVRERVFRTPLGPISLVERVLPGTVWVEKFPFESEKDYPALEYVIANRIYEPDFDAFLADDVRFGDKSIARPETVRAPLHELMYQRMGLEAFAVEWSERRGQVLRLLEVLACDWRRRVELIASSPARFAVVDANTEFRVVGEERYRQYHMPFIEEACRLLQREGILVGAHLDGNNRGLAPLVAETSLDFIESFTPPPECDLSIREARSWWPEKSLVVHFPSSAHLGGPTRVVEVAREILRDAAPGYGIAIGISEDVPDRGRSTILPLFRYLAENCQLPLPTD